jgi:hypothetical protein
MALLCRVLAAASIAGREPEEGGSADVDEEKLYRCFEMLQAANCKRTTKNSATIAPPDKICQPAKICLYSRQDDTC